MKKNMKRVVSGVLGAASMMTAVAAQAEAAIPALQEREAETYAKVANVKGDFHFHQDALTPADEVFNLFGTVATAACAKPGFAFEGIQAEDYYVNVKGTVKKAYSLTLEQIKAKEAKEEILKCSCLSGMAIAQAGVKGVKVSDIVEMAEIEEDTNTITSSLRTVTAWPCRCSMCWTRKRCWCTKSAAPSCLPKTAASCRSGCRTPWPSTSPVRSPRSS